MLLILSICVRLFTLLWDLIIALLTSGNSPALAQKVKREINPAIGEEHSVLNQLSGESRLRVLDKIKQ